MAGTEWKSQKIKCHYFSSLFLHWIICNNKDKVWNFGVITVYTVGVSCLSTSSLRFVREIFIMINRNKSLSHVSVCAQKQKPGGYVLRWREAGGTDPWEPTRAAPVPAERPPNTRWSKREAPRQRHSPHIWRTKQWSWIRDNNTRYFSRWFFVKQTVRACVCV